MFIDSHAHLYDPKFDSDLERVLDRARAAGVERVLTFGDTMENSKRAIGLALRYPMSLAGVGVHPHHAREWSEEKLAELRKLAETPRVVAIGEIGLDYHYNHASRAVQRRAFREQLALAREMEMPVSIHCREAYEDLFEDLREEKAGELGGAIHCFSGEYEDAARLVDMGFYLGVGGTMTFPNAGPLRDAIKKIGIDYLTLETDAPYLAPQPKRGRRNEPAHLPYTARALAELTGHGYRDTARATRYNTQRAFRLSCDVEPQVVYIWEGRIYINLTNDCTNDCEFCHKFGEGVMRGVKVRLDAEPSEEAVLAAAVSPNYECYNEVVFSGLGEPTMRFDLLLRVARKLRGLGKRIVLETNGQAQLYHQESVIAQIEGLVDCLRVSLNAPTREAYNALCHPEDPERAFGAVCDLIRAAKGRIPEVVATALDLPEVDLEATRRLAEDELGVSFFIRPVERVT